jgi:hypothetical protein
VTTLKLPVKHGCGYITDGNLNPRLMTRQQAQRHGERTMPADLKRAGFQCVVAQSDPEMHGGSWFRINYGKKV